ncbi:hypothetical protein TX23_01195 [Pseudomonas paralactis]|uniref:Uncharacterized protein n=1 Tax=Pseudomonas paralactis TaxID=1615673 RepID=A0A0R3ANK0_9PSED|nr:hypothetical protein [Pseudomonas paralactis]KRP74832.1 hypothetical protein TX23_01195 [Pseudomonas paralactis]
MPKRYEVLERSFINGRLYEPKETVVLEIDSPGSNLKEFGAAKAPTIQKDADGLGLGYVAARGAAGKYVIKDDKDQRVGEFIGSKAEAEVEADRLNAGGEVVVPTIQKDAGGDGGAGQDNTNGNGLPDA